MLYIIDRDAYSLKLELNIPINKYDLLNNGNLGKNGANKLINGIKENCSSKKCTFIVSPRIINNEESQYNQEIIHYVIDNYKSYGNLYDYDLIIYKNY